MKHGYPTYNIRLFCFLMLMAWGLVKTPCASAFSLDTYAPSSKLSSGRWVKIKVSSSGVYLIPNSELQRWGFSDPSKVKIYGYGGAPISDVLTADNYIDDLPQAMSEATSRGVVFYAQGAVVPVEVSGGGIDYDRNYYSTDGYYFVTDGGDDAISATTGTAGVSGSVAGSFTEMVYHEQELVSPGSTGHTFLGEDFSSTRTRSFNFSLPDKVGDNVGFTCYFAAKTIGAGSQINFSVNGTGVEATLANSIDASVNDSHRHYVLRSVKHVAPVSGEDMELSVSFSTSSGNVKLARLDRIVVNYSRQLRLSSGLLDFHLNSGAAALAGATSGTRLWDVTDPSRAAKVNASLSGSELGWTATESGLRHYVAWNEDASMPSPTYVGAVDNQDIHGRETPQMIIITMPEWRSQAEEIAELHRNSTDLPLDVMVVNQDEVFNEFSSGTPHVNAFRRMFKMFWDRGRDGEDSRMAFALLLGRGIYDHRAISNEVKALGKPVLLQWQTVDGSHDNSSYTTEDYLAFLEDGSGSKPGRDRHCLAIGRIPVTSTADASLVVEKLRSYIADDKKVDWKNRMVLSADDENVGIHLEQMEDAYNALISTDEGRNCLYTKVYVDAFPLVDNVAVGAHDRMMRALNSGVLWWWYIGHANTFSWTGEGLLTRQDIEAAYFTRQPMLFAANCDFLRWDLPDNSGAESLFFNPNGIIGSIAATRPVYIAYNGDITVAVASKVFDRYDDGTPIPVGEIMRRAKNTMLDNEENKLRYVLLGDPALVLRLPNNRMVLDRINGETVDPEAQPTIKARQNVTIEGHVVASDGSIAEDFNGVFVPTLYDAEYSTTTLAHGDGKESTFEEQGDRLYVGRDSVRQGRFNVTISMPTEIASNFRPAALNMFAFTADGRDASGVNRDFFVYGYDESREDDLTPPVIEYFALNSVAFRDGQRVNSSPTVIARMSDDVGINISSAGIGHQISLQLDGNKTYSDIAQYYEPGDEGPVWGTLSYPLSGLKDGDHSLRLRVWDTSNNLAESTISFTVKDGRVPEIINLYADCSPAVDRVNFMVEHNKPGANADVTLAVYDLMGRMVWSTKRSGDSASAPMEWNLSDTSGRRVPRGIYVYRATVSIDGEQHVSAARKLAVAAQ